MKKANIVLIGLPGCGKSTLGRQAAKQLGMPFIDLDACIEKEAGISIPQIFEKYGEGGFRRLETAAAERAMREGGAVIATGGGIVTVKENKAVLQNGGIIVFINRDVNSIINDVRTDTRPLLRQGSQRVLQLDAERRALYMDFADYIFENEKNFYDSKEKLARLFEKITRPQNYCVIGDPVAHSLSPVIHTAVMQRYLAQPFYGINRVLPGELNDFVRQVKEKKTDGFNITMPHKAAVIPLLDEVDADALRLNSVNTVVNTGGVLKGYSTDGAGFFTALKDKGFVPENKEVLVLGAGGASSAVCMKAAEMGAACVTVAARNTEKAENMLASVKKAFKNTAVNTIAFDTDKIKAQCKSTKLLINATPLGMQGVQGQFEDLSFIDALPAGAAVCDLIYKPDVTLFMEYAEKHGYMTMGGLNMLVYQALIADEYYLREKLCFEKLYPLVKQALGKYLTQQ